MKHLLMMLFYKQSLHSEMPVAKNGTWRHGRGVLIELLTTLRSLHPEEWGMFLFSVPFLHSAPDLTSFILKPLLFPTKIQILCLLLCHESYKVSKNTPFPLTDSHSLSHSASFQTAGRMSSRAWVCYSSFIFNLTNERFGIHMNRGLFYL